MKVDRDANTLYCSLLNFCFLPSPLVSVDASSKVGGLLHYLKKDTPQVVTEVHNTGYRKIRSMRTSSGTLRELIMRGVDNAQVGD